MANTIQLKRGTGSSEPSSLAEGELAINLDSGKLFYGSGSSVLSDFKVDKLTAETYVVSSSVTHMTTSFSSGSTAFGDSAGDAHTFTGDITASGIISASGDIIGQNFTAHDVLSTSFTGSVDNPAIRLGPLSGNLSGNKVGIMLEDAVPDNKLFVPYFVSNGSKVFGFGTNMEMHKSIQMNEYKISFDGDAGNTFIHADSATPENLEIHADGNLELRAQDDLQVYSDIDITGEITASGHISSSANVYAADYFDNGVNINTLYAQITGSDDNYVTDAEKTVIGNTSNTNSGDETTATVNALNITEVGALADGTIASGFGNIDNGTSTIDTGEITATSIKHSISGNNAGDYGPGSEILYGISSETTTAGVIYTLRNGVWTQIDASADNTVYNLCAVAVGTNSSTDGMLIKGCVTLASAYTAGSDSEGIPVYASETAGQATITAPSDSGDLVRILGYSLNVSSKKMFFNPDSTYVEIA